MTAGDVVAEFMTAEDAENGRTVGPAPSQRRARDGENKQQGMQPFPVLKFLRRLPDGFHLPDILQVFTWFESNRTTRRDADFFTGSRVSPDAALARLHLEHAEATKLDALAPL